MCERCGLFDGIDDLTWHCNVSPAAMADYSPLWNISPTMPILGRRSLLWDGRTRG